MALSQYAVIDGVTIGSSEVSIVSGTTSLQTKTDNGIYHLWVDPVQGGAMTKGDYFEVAIYEKVELTGGTKRKLISQVIGNAQAESWVSPAFLLKNGWDMTIKKIAGTDRAWDASIRGIAATIAEPYVIDGVTVGASELSVVSGTTSLQTITTDGVYQLFVDAAAMAKGDEYAVKVYEKVEASGGTKRQVFKASLMDLQSQLFVTPQFQLMHGWDMTIQKVSGTDRAFDASIRRIG